MEFRIDVIATLFVVWSICSCYNPVQERPLQLESDVSITAGLTVYPQNGGMQTCNPSISQDTVNFRGAMLWLNFSGTLLVNTGALPGFTSFAAQHDRITITDTSNTVRWFIMQEEMGASRAEQIQDPEWSTHPEYLVCLLSSLNGQKWSGYAIHTLTKDYLKLCHEKMDQVSTPHLWVSSEAQHSGTVGDPHYDTSGFVDAETVGAFFGTKDVKIVYSRLEGRVLSLYYKDYGVDSKPIRLPRPSDREGFNLESALISPDGKWIVYNAYKTTRYYESYIQELRAGAQPVLIAEGASDPHWFIHPDDPSLVSVVYTSIPGDNLVMEDLSDPELALTGAAGITIMQQMRLFPGRPSRTGIIKEGIPVVLANLPLKGGLSPDGAFLCTGYEKAYIVRIY